MSVAQWEREVIGQRTRDALAARRAAGQRLGKERMASAEAVTRMTVLRTAGNGPALIARALNAEGIPTPNGGARWYPSTVAPPHRSGGPRCSLSF